MRRAFPAILFLGLAGGCHGGGGGPSTPSSGDLDPGFGAGGTFATSIGGQVESAHAVLIQPDGKILAGGSAEDPVTVFDDDFALARLLPDGTPDASFGQGGFVRTEVGTQFDEIRSLELLSDGRIFAAGSVTTSGAVYIALARYLPDGALDTTFAGDGVLTTPYFCSSANEGKPAILQPDGKILVVGNDDGMPQDFFVARLDAAGSLDLSFGGGTGYATVDVELVDNANVVIVQSDGKIVLAGGEFDFKMARFDGNGALDPTFGNGGIVKRNHLGDRESALSLLIEPDGKLLVLAKSLDAITFQITGILTRYTSDGVLDPSIGGADGFVPVLFAPNSVGPSGMAIQGDGKIVVAGTGETGAPSDNYDFALARFAYDGVVDAGFGPNGTGQVLTDFGYPDFGHAVAVQPDGGIVVAGSAEIVIDADFAFARYLP